MKCIETAVNDFPEVKKDFEDIIADVQSANYMDLIVKIQALVGPAKDIYNACAGLLNHQKRKFKGMLNNLKFPNNADIMKCIETAVNDFPEIKKDFEAIVADIQSGNYMDLIFKIEALAGPAKDIYTACAAGLVRNTRRKLQEMSLKANFPGTGDFMTCIETAVTDFPEVKKDFEDIYADIQSGNYMDLIIKVQALAGPAKEIYYACAGQLHKQRSSKPQQLQLLGMTKKPNLKFPDINKIMNCIMGAVVQFPDVKAQFDEIISLFKGKKYIECLFKLASLSGPAKEIYNGCK
jgi:hypothetical protein